MDRAILLDHLEGEVAALLELAAAPVVSLAAVAPGCAPMTGLDVLHHLGRIYTGVRGWVTEGRRPTHWPTGPDDPAAAAAWVGSAAHAMIDTLLPRRAGSPAATWCPYDRTSGFWFRRMAHETAVHRVDVQQALGRPWRLDPDLATDGIAEAIEVWLGIRLAAPPTGTGRTVLLSTHERDWRIRPLADCIDFPTAGPADATVGGDAAAVWAWVWGRSDDSAPVTITGDPTAADELHRLFATATACPPPGVAVALPGRDAV
ncbi:MAG: maleylpyruvate isomerase N-terminal domain-containing protein [Nakamurella sp.]